MCLVGFVTGNGADGCVAVGDGGDGDSGALSIVIDKVVSAASDSGSVQ